MECRNDLCCLQSCQDFVIAVRIQILPLGKCFHLLEVVLRAQSVQKLPTFNVKVLSPKKNKCLSALVDTSWSDIKKQTNMTCKGSTGITSCPVCRTNTARRCEKCQIKSWLPLCTQLIWQVWPACTQGSRRSHRSSPTLAMYEETVYIFYTVYTAKTTSQNLLESFQKAANQDRNCRNRANTQHSICLWNMQRSGTLLWVSVKGSERSLDYPIPYFVV